MSSTIWCLIFPVAWFTFSSLIFQGNQNTAPLDETQDIIFCDYPNFDLGTNSTGNGCPASVIEPNSSYADDVYILWEVGFNFFSENSTNVWNATIPAGWNTYSGDVISVTFAKVGAVLLYFPLLILTLSTPVDLQTELGQTVTGAYSVLWGVFFFGVYKGISPFTGGH